MKRAGSGIASPSTPRGTPFPSNRSNACSSESCTSGESPSRSAIRRATSQWAAKFARTPFGPAATAAATARIRAGGAPVAAAARKRSTSVWRAGSIAAHAARARTSSPNSAAVSWAFDVQPTACSNAV